LLFFGDSVLALVKIQEFLKLSRVQHPRSAVILIEIRSLPGA
jgi:hypothetical protein